jgi:hypothetical protein
VPKSDLIGITDTMKPRSPQVAIATLMGLILLLAVNCALLRNPLGGDPDVATLRRCTLPMANVLAFGLYLYVIRSRRGQKDPFLLGFAVFGCAALAAFLYGCEASPMSLILAVLPIVSPIRRMFKDTVAHEYAIAVSLTVLSLVLTVLFSLIALVGGCLTRRLKGAVGRLVNIPALLRPRGRSSGSGTRGSGFGVRGSELGVREK